MMKAQTPTKFNNQKTSKKSMMKQMKTPALVKEPLWKRETPAQTKLEFAQFNTRDLVSSSLISVFPGVNTWTSKHMSSSLMEYS